MLAVIKRKTGKYNNYYETVDFNFEKQNDIQLV